MMQFYYHFCLGISHASDTISNGNNHCHNRTMRDFRVPLTSQWLLRVLVTHVGEGSRICFGVLFLSQ